MKFREKKETETTTEASCRGDGRHRGKLKSVCKERELRRRTHLRQLLQFLLPHWQCSSSSSLGQLRRLHSSSSILLLGQGKCKGKVAVVREEDSDEDMVDLVLEEVEVLGLVLEEEDDQ